MKFRVKEIYPDTFEVQCRFLFIWFCACYRTYPFGGRFKETFPALHVACEAMQEAQKYNNFKPKIHQCCD